jgi:hypothetical protein
VSLSHTISDYGKCSLKRHHSSHELPTVGSEIECPTHTARPSVITSVPPTRGDNGVYTLDFGSPGVLPSVRNFQLETSEGTKVFQFYKRGPNEFGVEWSPAMSPAEVMSLCVASIETKLCTQ